MLGGYAMTAMTAVTAQNTLGVTRHPCGAGRDRHGADRAPCIDDIGVDAVKIGMIGSAEIVAAVADALAGVTGADRARSR